MNEKDTNLLHPLLIAVFLVVAFGVIGTFDYAEALVQDSIRKDPPKILSYSIKQDSPGLDKGEPMLPLHQPVASSHIRKHRRSHKEQR